MVGKANLTFEILAAAFGIEMPHLEMIFKFIGVHVVVVMSQTMLTEHRGVAETGHQMVVFIAKMKVNVQSVSDKQHIKCHQKRPDLKDFSFHDAKLKKILIFAVWNNITLTTINMKKVTLLLGAIVLGFMLTSCENKKQSAINLFNTFFDEEISILNKVEDADAWMAYYDAASERFDNFFTTLNEQVPLDDDGNIIGLKQADSDEALKVYDDRMDDYLAKRDAKGSALYEPFISDLEGSFDEIMGLFDQYENVEDIPDEAFDPLYENFVEKFDLADQYVLLSDDEQYDRYLVLYDLLYGDEESEE